MSRNNCFGLGDPTFESRHQKEAFLFPKSIRLILVLLFGGYRLVLPYGQGCRGVMLNLRLMRGKEWREPCLHCLVYLYGVGTQNITYKFWYLLSCKESQAVSNVASVKDPVWTRLNLNISFFLLEMDPVGDAVDSSYDARPKTPHISYFCSFCLFFIYYYYYFFPSLCIRCFVEKGRRGCVFCFVLIDVCSN